MSAAQNLAKVAGGKMQAPPPQAGMSDFYQSIAAGPGSQLSAPGAMYRPAVGPPCTSYPGGCGSSHPARKRKSPKEPQRSPKPKESQRSPKARRTDSNTAILSPGSESESPGSKKGRGRGRDTPALDGITVGAQANGSSVWPRLPKRHITTLTWQLAWDMLTHTEFEGSGDRPRTLKTPETASLEEAAEQAYGTIYVEKDPSLRDSMLKVSAPSQADTGAGTEENPTIVALPDKWECTVGRKGVHLHKTPDGRFGVVRKTGFAKVVAAPAPGEASQQTDGEAADSTYISVKYHEYIKVSFDSVGGGGGTWANIDVGLRGGKQLDSRTIFHVIVPNNRGKITARGAVRSVNVGPPQGAPVRLLEEDGTLTVRAGRGMSPSLQAATAKYAAARAKADAAYKQRAASASLARLQQLKAQEKQRQEQENEQEREQRHTNEQADNAVLSNASPRIDGAFSKQPTQNQHRSDLPARTALVATVHTGATAGTQDTPAAATATKSTTATQESSPPLSANTPVNSATTRLGSTSESVQGPMNAEHSSQSDASPPVLSPPGNATGDAREAATSTEDAIPIPVLDRDTAIETAKQFYDADGPFAKAYTMQVIAAYRNSPTQWSLEYTTSPPSDTHLVQFSYEPIAPKNRSLGKLALRLQGLPPRYYWRWGVASMDERAGTRVEATSPTRTRAKKAAPGKAEGKDKSEGSNSPLSQAGMPSTEASLLI